MTTVAEVKYTGDTMNVHRLSGPSGTRYRMPRRENGRGGWVPVEDAEDAEWLEGKPNVDVRWKPLGRLRARGESAIEAVAEMAYSKKQDLVDELGVDIAKNSSDEDLEEAITDHLKELHEQGDL